MADIKRFLYVFMTEKNWVESTQKPPTPEEINAKVAARLEFFERELREQGYALVAGAELEFHVQKADGMQWSSPLSFIKIKNALHEQLPLLEKFEKEHYSKGLYEIVLGTKKPPDGKYYPSVQIAEAIEDAKTVVPKVIASSHRGSKVSFHARPPCDSRSTAGLHINTSIYKDGRNSFSSPNDSSLMRGCAGTLLELQIAGLSLYTPSPKSFQRFGARDSIPDHFRIGGNYKNDETILLRTEPDDFSGRIIPDYFHIEDRLAGADANPYFAMLANVGAIWDTVVNGGTFTMHATEPILKPGETPEAAHARALDTFAHSDLWRRIAGEDLYKDL